MDDLLRKVQRAETASDLMLIFERHFGTDTATYVVYAALVSGCLFAVYVVRGLVQVLWTPAGSLARRDAEKQKKKMRHGTSDKRPGAPEDINKKELAVYVDDAPNVPSKSRTVAAAQSDVFRTRPLHCEPPASSIKGFHQVGVLATSPCQRYLIASCRRSGKARWYPQSDKKLFMEKGAELRDKYFVSLDACIKPLLPTSQSNAMVDVSVVAFSADGMCFALGESTSDRIVVFSVKGGREMEVLHQVRMPDRRLVRSLGTAVSLGSNGDTVFCAHDDNAEVEMLHLKKTVPPQPAAGSSRTAVAVATTSSVRCGVGSGVAWALCGETAVVAGSFLKEARIMTLVPNHDHSQVSMNKSFIAPAVKSETGVTCRVAAVGFIRKNVPAWNTREYLIVFLASGDGYVYDVSGDEQPCIILRGRFKDADFALDSFATPADTPVASMGSAGTRSRSIGMSVAIAGGVRCRERLRLALWCEHDISVHVQVDDYDWDNNVPFEMVHQKDYHDAHDTSPIQMVTFVQHGEGLASSGRADDLGIRLWNFDKR